MVTENTPVSLDKKYFTVLFILLNVLEVLVLFLYLFYSFTFLVRSLILLGPIFSSVLAKNTILIFSKSYFSVHEEVFF